MGALCYTVSEHRMYSEAQKRLKNLMQAAATAFIVYTREQIYAHKHTQTYACTCINAEYTY